MEQYGRLIKKMIKASNFCNKSESVISNTTQFNDRFHTIFYVDLVNQRITFHTK